MVSFTIPTVASSEVTQGLRRRESSPGKARHHDSGTSPSRRPNQVVNLAQPLLLTETYMCSRIVERGTDPEGLSLYFCRTARIEVGMNGNRWLTTMRPARPLSSVGPGEFRAGRPRRERPTTKQVDILNAVARVPPRIRRRMQRLRKGLGRRAGRTLVAPLTLPRQGHSHRPHHAPGRRHRLERAKGRLRAGLRPPRRADVPHLPVRARRADLRPRIRHQLPLQPPGLPLPQPDGRPHRGPRRPGGGRRRRQTASPRPPAHDRQSPRGRGLLLRLSPLEAGDVRHSADRRGRHPKRRPRRPRHTGHDHPGGHGRPQAGLGRNEPPVPRRHPRQVPRQPGPDGRPPLTRRRRRA